MTTVSFPDDDRGNTSVGGTPTAFKLPSGVKRSVKSFNPNFGLESPWGQPQDIDSVKAIEKKANTFLSRYGYSHIDQSEYDRTPNYISSEVGDDEQTVSDSKAFIGYQLVFQQLMGMKVSWEDTSISSRFGNFAEDMIVLPDGYGQTYLHARNTNSWEDMSFMDIPKLRLAIDIRPMRMDHSSTNDGKAAMVGSRQSWIPMTSPLKASYEVFSLFQDVNLGLIRDKKFPYLPQSLGGYGKAYAFDNPENLIRFCHAYKQGSHSLLIGNIINRTVDFLEKLSRGKDPAKDPLLSHVVRFQSSFHDWIKGRSIYAPVTWIDVPPEVAMHSAGKLGKHPTLDAVFGRLLAERRLLSEQQLQIAVEHNELCSALLRQESITSFKKLRDEARLRFHNLSIFSLENYGMIREITLDQTRDCLLTDCRKIAKFKSLVKDSRYNLRFVLSEEDVYYPEAMDSIYKTGPMSVQFTFNPRNKIGGMGFAAQTRDYANDVEDTEDRTSVDDLMTWLRSERDVAKLPRRAINDDDPIIQLCTLNMYNIIVTDDIKLCRKAERISGNVIIRKPVFWYYQEIYYGAESFIDTVARKFPGKEFVEHEDSGSIQSFEENHFFDGVMLEEHIRQPFNVWKNPKQKDQRRMGEMPFDATTRVVFESLVFDHTNSLRGRRRGARAPKIDPNINWIEARQNRNS